MNQALASLLQLWQSSARAQKLGLRGVPFPLMGEHPQGDIITSISVTYLRDFK